MGEDQLNLETLLHTEALDVGHGRQLLLADVRIDARQGELIAIIGANGTGKSTLLRTMAGLHPPMSGKITLGGRNMNELSAWERARVVSIVLTGRARTGLLDVETLVSLGRQPWTGSLGRLNDEDRVHVQQAMEQVEVIDLRHRAVALLSDGEIQRVMIARALAQHTPLILLDEPTAFLDVTHRVQVVQLLRSITRMTTRAVLFSSHDLQLALDLCDRLVILRRDRSIWQGKPVDAIAKGILAGEFERDGLRFDPVSRSFRVAT